MFVEDSYICMRCTALQVPGVGELRVCGTPEAPAQPCQPPGPPLPSQDPLRRTTCPHHFNSCLDRHQARCLTVCSPPEFIFRANCDWQDMSLPRNS